MGGPAGFNVLFTCVLRSEYACLCGAQVAKWFEEMEWQAPIIAALIAALVSLLSLFVNGWLSWQVSKRQDEVERLKADLEAQNLHTEADLSYQFEARKNLYRVCEPLFFQIQEAAADAVKVIESLLDEKGQDRLVTKREKDVEEDVWMLTNSSALVYTLYALYKPLALFRILRGKINSVDLSLDEKVLFRYHLGKELYETLVSDAEIALLKPDLDYDPLAEDWREKRVKNPAKYWWQGISPGRLDNVLAMMIEDDRVIDFGTFEGLHRAAFDGRDIRLNKLFGVAGNLLYGFNPKDRPVGWRVLLILLHLNYVLSQPASTAITRQSQKQGELPSLFKLPDAVEKKIDQAIEAVGSVAEREEDKEEHKDATKAKHPKIYLWRSQCAVAYLNERLGAYT